MLPKTLKYGSKVESSFARSFRTNVAPQNGTGNYVLGDNIIINIPTRNNLVLVPSESYLKFNLTITNTSGANNTYRFDSCGAHGLIQRIRIFHGSNLLQDIDNYNLLAKMLFDLQVPFDAVQGKNNILCGTRSDLTLTLPTAAAPAAPGNTTANIDTAVNTALAPISAARVSAFNTNSGDVIASSLANNGTSTAKTYCLNLVSLVGTLCSSNYIPLFAATSAPLRVEIQLVDSIAKFCACTSAAGSITVSNCEYVANFIELGDSAVSMVLDSLQGQPLQFVVPDYRNYQGSFSLAAAATQYQLPIPAKFSSLKSLFVTVRDKGTGVASYFPFSSCTKQISDYYFRVGASIMPPKAPNTYPEMFSEVLKAIDSMGNIGHQPAIDLLTYTLQDSVAVADTVLNVNSGSFYIGLDLENYAGSSKENIFAGYNSNTDDIYCVMNFAAQGAAITTRFDAFALFDSVVVFDNNTAYIKF